MIRKIAVIDIGSNSCRMVVYETDGAAFLPYFNEKTMAGLGRGLPETGHLCESGKIKALDTFRRFNAILSTLNIDEIYPVATSAVREASDGAAFAAQAEQIIGKPLRILSGADEGRISALGVRAGFSKPMGLIADLGGSSLELQRLDEGRTVGTGETFLLGPLARAADRDLRVNKRRKLVSAILADSGLIPFDKGDLFAVGGAWRNVAAVHMALVDYPLRVVHGYQMNRDAIGRVLNASLGIGREKYKQVDVKRVAKRRFETLSHAALVLDVLLEMSGQEKVCISAYGLREGVMANADGVSTQAPERDTARLYLKLSPDSSAFGAQLQSFVSPLFQLTGQTTRVLSLACLVADAGARMHPDHRSMLVFENILRAPIPGLTHQERLFVATAVASRYTFKFELRPKYKAFADKGLFEDARMIGTAMRLGGVFSGRSAQILETASLNVDNKTLLMRVKSNNKDMVSGTVERRLKQLASLLDRDATVELA